MSSLRSKKQGTYSSVEEQDLGHESDSTTAFSDRFLEEKEIGTSREKWLSRARKAQTALTWIRWGVLIGLQLLIVMLLFWKSQGSTGDEMGRDMCGTIEVGGDLNGIYKSQSYKVAPFHAEEHMFMPNMSSTDETQRMAIRENWDQLLPKGSGNVVIKNWSHYPMLGSPIRDDHHHPNISNTSDDKDGLYQTTWTHALHCLYHHVDTYHQLNLHLNNHNLTKDTKWIDQHHATHCLEYLRNYILCSADMTLEGGSSKVGHEGVDQQHVCRNREEAVAWIEDHRIDDVRSIVHS